jgi:hypothetical protein
MSLSRTKRPPPTARYAPGRADFAPHDATLRVLVVAARRFAAPALAADTWYLDRGE